VRVEASHDQYNVRMKLEGWDGTGTWITLSDKPELSEVSVPKGLRRMAIQELKARAITHLLVWDSDFGADEIRVNTAVWGVSLVREYGPIRLYKLN
jgi:hypothetical protein